MTEEIKNEGVPSSFFWRRLHSLTGFVLVLFLLEHLLTNSQAALFLGEDGKGFIEAVNWIHSLPYLPVIELGLLAIPLLIHAAWGVKYLFTAKFNNCGNTGKDPYLPNYLYNHFYTWQRITSWILLLGIFLHVAQMRFFLYPTKAKTGSEMRYIVKVANEPGIYTLSERLNVDLLNQRQVEEQKVWAYHLPEEEENLVESLLRKQATNQEKAFANALEKWNLGQGELAAVTKDAGVAFLLNVRSVMSSFWMRILYTVFVLSAVYHACNGLWTFLITWGITLTKRSQRLCRFFVTGLMIGLCFLGLCAIWITSLVNIRS